MRVHVPWERVPEVVPLRYRAPPRDQVLGDVDQLAAEWMGVIRRPLGAGQRLLIRQRAYEAMRCHWSIPSVLRGRFDPGVIVSPVNSYSREHGTRGCNDAILSWRTTPHGVTYETGNCLSRVLRIRFDQVTVGSLGSLVGRAMDASLPLLLDLRGWQHEMDRRPPWEVRRLLLDSPESS